VNIFEIKKYPDSILRQQCSAVAGIGGREKKIFHDMLNAMRYFRGIGLAGPQVGLAEQILVADIGEGPLCLANPKIIEGKGQGAIDEGCLSVPDVFVKVKRRSAIVVEGLNENGSVQTVTASGLMAMVLQHEIDHLHGKLIIDYFSPIEFERFRMKQMP